MKRSTLARAIKSAKGADEILVDINTDDDHGYKARTRMIEKATSTHLAFLDDDDIYTPDAIHWFRKYAEDVPVVFRMQYRAGGVLWRDKVVRYGNVGTPMILVPNVPDKLGSWVPHAGAGSGGGDWSFLVGCVQRMGAPVWRTEIVCLVRPE